MQKGEYSTKFEVSRTFLYEFNDPNGKTAAKMEGQTSDRHMEEVPLHNTVL